MTRRDAGERGIRAALALSISLVLGAAPAGAAPAPVAAPAVASAALPNLGAQATVTRLGSGGLGIVRPLSGAPVAAIELWYRAPSTGFGARPVPALARVAAQVVAASRPLVGRSLGELVRAYGGRLGVTVYSDSVSISAVVPSGAAATVVRAMTTGYFAPVVTQDGYESAEREVAQAAFLDDFNPESVVRDEVFGQLFASGPQHYSVYGTTREIAAISLDTVRSYAARAFRSQNAVLVVSGAVGKDILGSAVSGRPADGLLASGELPAPSDLAPAPQPVSKRFAEPSGGYGWVGPPIADERAATALDFIADYLFRPDAGTVANLVAKNDAQALVSGQFITLHDPGVMVVVYSGKHVEDIRSTVDGGFASIQQPLERGRFDAAIAAFKNHLLSDLQTPVQLADNFGWYTVEGNPEYAPGTSGDAGKYFAAASSLTPAFVAGVAKMYLGKPPVVVSLLPSPAPAASGTPAVSPAPVAPAPAVSPTPQASPRRP